MSYTSTGFLFSVNKEADEPLYGQIYLQFKSAIEKGLFKVNDKLPSIRSLAEDLQVSHITVERAYLQLSLEGYIISRPRSGYVVEAIDRSYLAEKAPDNRLAVDKITQLRKEEKSISGNYCPLGIKYDLSYFRLQRGSFPKNTWLKLTREVLNDANDLILTSYAQHEDSINLRGQITEYTARNRGVRAFPEQVIVAPASESAVHTVLQLFDKKTDIIGHEEPGWNVVVDAARRARFKILPLPTDVSSHLYLKRVQEMRPKIIFTTPSHQHPTGEVMTLETRIELLKTAQKIDAYILEDDSCSEYRYGTSAVPSLQSLDTSNRVIYMNNFSKTLSPGLRVAYLILPPQLLEKYYILFTASLPSVSLLTQEILAKFIAGGFFEKNTRRMVTSSRHRHDSLTHCLKKELGDKVTLSGVGAGIHFLATVHNGMNQDELVRTALNNSVAVYKTTHCWFSKKPPDNQLMIGFSAIDLQDIPLAARALKHAWLTG